MAIAIVKSSAEFMYDVKIIVVVPVIIFIILMLYWAYWIVVFVYLYSLGDIKANSDFPLANVTWDDRVKNLLWYHLFIGLWHNTFLLSLNQFIVASACSIWYFSDKQALFHFPVSKSVFRAFRYHLGTLAFGSFLIALV